MLVKRGGGQTSSPPSADTELTTTLVMFPSKFLCLLTTLRNTFLPFQHFCNILYEIFFHQGWGGILRGYEIFIPVRGLFQRRCGFLFSGIGFMVLYRTEWCYVMYGFIRNTSVVSREPSYSFPTTSIAVVSLLRGYNHYQGTLSSTKKC